MGEWVRHFLYRTDKLEFGIWGMRDVCDGFLPSALHLNRQWTVKNCPFSSHFFLTAPKSSLYLSALLVLIVRIIVARGIGCSFRQWREGNGNGGNVGCVSYVLCVCMVGYWIYNKNHNSCSTILRFIGSNVTSKFSVHASERPIWSFRIWRSYFSFPFCQ